MIADTQKYLVLLVALLGVFLTYPLALHETAGTTIVNILTLVIAGSAVYTLRLRRAHITISILLAAPALIADWATDSGFVGNVAINAAGSVCYGLFFAYAGAMIIMRVLEPKRVTANEVWGASCGYLMLALVWANLYHALQIVAPGSFVSAERLSPIAGSGGALESDLLYYSLTTLTTFGIGDILPLTRTARMLTALEAVIGQLYLAILVARFVGLHVAHASRE